MWQSLHTLSLSFVLGCRFVTYLLILLSVSLARILRCTDALQILLLTCPLNMHNLLKVYLLYFSI